MSLFKVNMERQDCFCFVWGLDTTNYYDRYQLLFRRAVMINIWVWENHFFLLFVSRSHRHRHRLVYNPFIFISQSWTDKSVSKKQLFERYKSLGTTVKTPRPDFSVFLQDKLLDSLFEVSFTVNCGSLKYINTWGLGFPHFHKQKKIINSCNIKNCICHNWNKKT